MRLSIEAVRDVLLYLEQNLEPKINNNKFEYDSISYFALVKALTPSKHYSEAEVMYAVIKLKEDGLIAANVATGKNKSYIQCFIYDITSSGHKLIADIKPQKVWEKVKSQAEKEGILSITNLSKICGKVISITANNPELLEKITDNIMQ